MNGPLIHICPICCYARRIRSLKRSYCVKLWMALPGNYSKAGSIREKLALCGCVDDGIRENCPLLTTTPCGK